MSERALHEIYFPAFKAAVQEAGAGAVMSAYNKVNGVWCAENPHLLTEVLKKQWGFKGLVVSDWASTHTTVEMEKAGLDVEMPGAESLKDFQKDPIYSRFGFIGGFASPDKLLPVVRDGQIPQSLQRGEALKRARLGFEQGQARQAGQAALQVLGPKGFAARTRQILQQGGAVPRAIEKRHQPASQGIVELHCGVPAVWSQETRSSAWSRARGKARGRSLASSVNREGTTCNSNKPEA